MKTRSFLFGLAIIAASCGQTKQMQGYYIQGKIKGVDSGMVRLSSLDEDTRTSTVFDSATITNGTFRLEGKFNSPELVTISLGDGNWSFPFFLDNSNIDLSADTTGAEFYDGTAYGGSKGAFLKNYSVTGSGSHDKWVSFQNNKELKKYESKLIELSRAYSNATNKEIKEKVKEQQDSVLILSMASRRRLVDSFITANPASAASAYIFFDYYKYNRATSATDLESVLSKFKGDARSSVYFANLTKSLEKKKALQPGRLAPDFTLLKTDSSRFTLSSLKGKYVMLDFWASWCIPCRKAIPHWKEVYQKYQPKGFEIVGITNDFRWTDWFKALKEEEMPWIQVADEFPAKNMSARVATMYMTAYLPFYVLLDKEGKIILHNPSKEELDDKLKTLFEL